MGGKDRERERSVCAFCCLSCGASVAACTGGVGFTSTRPGSGQAEPVFSSVLGDDPGVDDFLSLA